MSDRHALFVCTTCASKWKNGERVGQSGGEKLLEAISTRHECWELREAFPLQPVDCMSACSRPCTISFAASGKFTFVFGNLSVDDADLQDTVEAIFTCAEQFHAKPDGLLTWAERPKPLKSGLVARIPAWPPVVSA
ncbi:MAG: DUF1636 domain-containing protein [Cyanobacteria bacterium P01_D01_bin.123]